MLTLSLIIPVYNEEHHIRECLEAVKRQICMPDEVIVVDNNCTDRTIEIVKEYDFVRIVSETKQGRAYARSAGFNAANSEILGRIDADSRIAPNWTKVVKASFEANKKLAGMGGLGRTVYVPGLNFLKSTLFTRSYYWFAHAGYNTMTMWGANMAIRRTAWQDVSKKVINDDLKVHEDQDVSLWIAANGGLLVQNNNMIVTTNGQSYRYLPKTWQYLQMFKHTKKVHLKIGNLHSPSLRKLGFWRTLPGRLAAYLPGLYLAIMCIVLFPVDFIVNKYWPKSWWLD